MIARILIVDDLAHCRQWLTRAARIAFPESQIETADSVAGALAGLKNSGLKDPGLKDPGLKDPGLKNPGLKNPGLKNPGLKNPGLKNPGLKNLPDLLVVDLGLPDGDGVQVIGEYRKACAQGMVVVSTVFDDDGHLFPALRAGAQGYVLKDEPIAQLAEMLAGILAGQPPLSASIARRLLRHFAQPVPEVESGEPLTERETDVLKLIAKGLTVPRVAELLALSRHTVSGYMKDIYRKLEISSRAEATMVAARRGFLN